MVKGIRKEKKAYITWEESDEDSSDSSNCNDIANHCHKHRKEEVSNDELDFLPTYDELHDAFEELYEETKRVTK